MTDQSAVDALRAARRDLLDIMRRMDCQDLFDDAFYALVRYERAALVAERAALAASATDEEPDPWFVEAKYSSTDEEPWKEDALRYAQNADYWRDQGADR